MFIQPHALLCATGEKNRAHKNEDWGDGGHYVNGSTHCACPIRIEIWRAIDAEFDGLFDGRTNFAMNIQLTRGYRRMEVALKGPVSPFSVCKFAVPQLAPSACLKQLPPCSTSQSASCSPKHHRTPGLAASTSDANLIDDWPSNIKAALRNLEDIMFGEPQLCHFCRSTPGPPLSLPRRPSA